MTSAHLIKRSASILRRSSGYLGAQFHRLRTKLGSPIAITAMAAKLARLVYRILKVKQLKWKPAKLGFQVVQAPAP